MVISRHFKIKQFFWKEGLNIPLCIMKTSTRLLPILSIWESRENFMSESLLHEQNQHYAMYRNLINGTFQRIPQHHHLPSTLPSPSHPPLYPFLPLHGPAPSLCHSGKKSYHLVKSAVCWTPGAGLCGARLEAARRKEIAGWFLSL